MAVHAAGPRLYRSIRFKHLVRRNGSAAGTRASNISLNLVPFVDMMTILVCFLLMVFQASGQLLQAQATLELPDARTKAALQEAPIITVTRNEITYQGLLVVTTEVALADDAANFQIALLHERLESAALQIKENIALERKFDRKQIEACQDKNVRREAGRICPEGLAILQADKETDARLINKIVNTAKAAGFHNLMFATKNK